MSEQEILSFAGGIPGASCDYPFDKDFETAVFRHTDTKKWFGILLSAPNRYFSIQPEDGETRILNVKVPPDLLPLLVENYLGIERAYHMNKTHWISILPDSDVHAEEIKNLIGLSFRITDKRSKK